MRKQHWFYIGWTIFVVAMLWNWRPWERDLTHLFLAFVGYLAIAVIVHFASKFETKHGIGEARFNSRTGKQLKPGEPNR